MIRTRFNKYWFSYFMIKLFYMFFALFVYSKITPLGDTSGYMNGTFYNSETFYYKSTSMMSLLGSTLTSLFGSVLSHVPFVVLSFYGIYYSVSRLKLSNKQLFYILLLLSLPSFGVWTSIISKEAIGVFFMGIILGYLIDLIENRNRKIKFIEYFAIYLLLIFKPQYFITIFSIFLFIKVSYFFELKASGKSILLLIYIIVTISLFYYFRELINNLSYIMPMQFSLDAGSTRENTIWINDYDVFYNAPYGMFIAVWGPTIGEILEKPIQSIAFIESLFIFSFFLFFLLSFLKKTLVKKKLNIYAFSLIFIMLFFILFVHYPFGVLNPGSAIRYRENFYGFLVVFLFYIYISHIKKKHTN